MDYLEKQCLCLEHNGMDIFFENITVCLCLEHNGMEYLEKTMSLFRT